MFPFEWLEMLPEPIKLFRYGNYPACVGIEAFPGRGAAGKLPAMLRHVH